MSNLPPSGWYPDPKVEGQTRFWDGTTWTEQTSLVSPGATQSAARMPKSDRVAAGTPFYKRTWVLVTAAALVALTAGVAAGSSTDVTATPEYRSLTTQLESAENDLDDAERRTKEVESELSQANEELATVAGDLPAREQAVNKMEKKLEKREASVSKKEKSVTAREKAVGSVETTIADNTINDGLYEVGVDIKAGTYKTKGAPGCYYAVLGSANTGDLINNSFNDGPAIAAVSAGQFLELSCDGADWVWQN